MDRLSKLNLAQRSFFEQLKEVHAQLDTSFLDEFDRSVSFGDVFIDRWERAKKLGFGEKTSIYDSSLVIGQVKVGSNCWVGPYTILDGSGGLEIGDFSTISAGVQLYSHDNIKSTLSAGKLPIEREKLSIGKNTYIGPNAIVAKGISIGNFCVIAAGSFVNKSFPDFSLIAGTPAKQIGIIKTEEDTIHFEYFNK